MHISIWPFRMHPDGLFVITDPLAEFNRKQIVELATRRRFPAQSENSPYVDAGGLMAYGPTTPRELPESPSACGQNSEGREARRSPRGATD